MAAAYRGSGHGSKTPPGVSLRGTGRAKRKLFPRDVVVQKALSRAKYRARCSKCNTWIHRGEFIRRDPELKKFVHAACVARQQAVVFAQETTADAPPSLFANVPHGLRQESIDSYTIEWNRYCKWATAVTGTVPGRDAPWTADVVWKYMQHRSKTCKPSTLNSVRTMLAHFGARFGHVLPTRKSDGNPAMHRALERMRKQLNMDACAAAEQPGPTVDIQHCVGLGKRTVGDIMSAYRMFGKAAFFRALPRIVRHNLVLNAVSHTGGMRYGHFPDRDYSIDAFVRDAEGSYRLITDWHRYAGRRMYCIEFPAVPRYEAQTYELRWPDGSVFDTITAATILD